VLATASSACGGELAHGQPRDASARANTSRGAEHSTAPAVTAAATAPAAATLPASYVATAAAPIETPNVEAPLGGPTPIEDPSGHAFDALYAALHRAQRGEGQARIVFYGASHTADDLFTGVLRQHLQQRFGEAGPGFVLPGKPWRWYRHAGISIEQTRGFKMQRIIEREPLAGIYGLAGVALESRGRNALAVISTRPNGGLSGRVSRFELYYLKQPGGGHLSVYIDGKRMQRLSTLSRRTEPGYARWQLADAQHRFELRAERDGVVRVFGVSLERDEPGVIVDTLGVPGSRVRDQLFWDDAVYREHLARRKPDMVVLTYGTNESGDDDMVVEQYEEKMRRVLTRVREVASGASCMLIGPSDRPLRLDDGTFADRPLTQVVTASQRKVAAEFGCGFFDLQRFMGGPLSMVRWVGAQPPLGTRDYVHFTLAGYERFAAVLETSLLAGYDDGQAPALAASPAAAPPSPAADEPATLAGGTR
jgi:lysophospholipase L1-like esterase